MVARVRPLVQPALAAQLVFEMLDGVGDEGVGTANAGIGQRLVENASGRPDKRLAGAVFAIAGLLADQHQRRVRLAFAGYDLGRAAIKVAAPALRLLAAQRRERGDRRREKVIQCATPTRGRTASSGST